MNVTKFELCTRLAKRFRKLNGKEIPTSDIKQIIELFLEDIIRTMAEGDRIEIRGFGCFKPTIRKKRIGRNPRTGDVVKIPSYEAPYFKFSKEAQKLFEEKKNEL